MLARRPTKKMGSGLDGGPCMECKGRLALKRHAYSALPGLLGILLTCLLFPRPCFPGLATAHASVAQLLSQRQRQDADVQRLAGPNIVDRAGPEDHGLEPGVENAGLLRLKVLEDVRFKSLRHCRSDFRHLLGLVLLQPVAGEGVPKAPDQLLREHIHKKIALVLLGLEVNREVQEVEGASEAPFYHLFKQLLRGVPVGDVANHHGRSSLWPGTM
mmetsp:Transcript_49119/g.117050  ORF Transcript_49119/g.117050 Transcript_49119/m.117050 type:complete len:215 (+) Transcript_49119:57-701(+)